MLQSRRYGQPAKTIQHVSSPFVKFIVIINFISVIYNTPHASKAKKFVWRLPHSWVRFKTEQQRFVILSVAKNLQVGCAVENKKQILHPPNLGGIQNDRGAGFFNKLLKHHHPFGARLAGGGGLDILDGYG
jgi:hypothetical protein